MKIIDIILSEPTEPRTKGEILMELKLRFAEIFKGDSVQRFLYPSSYEFDNHFVYVFPKLRVQEFNIEMVYKRVEDTLYQYVGIRFSLGSIEFSEIINDENNIKELLEEYTTIEKNMIIEQIKGLINQLEEIEKFI